MGWTWQDFVRLVCSFFCRWARACGGKAEHVFDMNWRSFMEPACRPLSMTYSDDLDPGWRPPESKPSKTAKKLT